MLKMGDSKLIKDYQYKITITVIGNRASGKTSLLNGLIYPTVIQKNAYIPSTGLDVRFLSLSKNIIVKFFDIGDLDINKNEKVFQSLSWYSHYIIYIIDPKIKESLDYISIFEAVFKQNMKILIFTKIDQIQNNKNFYLNDSTIVKFIKDNNIENIFYVSSFDFGSVNKLKNDLFILISKGINNRNYSNKIKDSDFFIIPVLYHRERPLIMARNKCWC